MRVVDQLEDGSVRAIVTQGTPRRIDLNPGPFDVLASFARRGLEHVRLTGPIALFLLCLATARRSLNETVGYFAAFASGCIVALGAATMAAGSAPFMPALQAGAAVLLVVAALQNITRSRGIWIRAVALAFRCSKGDTRSRVCLRCASRRHACLRRILVLLRRRSLAAALLLLARGEMARGRRVSDPVAGAVGSAPAVGDSDSFRPSRRPRHHGVVTRDVDYPVRRTREHTRPCPGCTRRAWPSRRIWRSSRLRSRVLAPQGLLPYQELRGHTRRRRPGDVCRTSPQTDDRRRRAYVPQADGGRMPAAWGSLTGFTWTASRGGLLPRTTSPRPGGDPSAAAWLLVIQGPIRRRRSIRLPTTRPHHRLPDGTVLHVSIWTHRFGAQIDRKFVRQPERSGWTRGVDGAGSSSARAEK